MGNEKREIAPQRKKREQWTEDKVAIICNEIAQGQTYERAFTKAHISKSVFYAHLKADSDFKDRVKKAEAEYNEYFDSNIVAISKRSLAELICGYEYDEITTETVPDGKTGKKVVKKKVVHKRVAPNATAIIFALCNRDPDHWQNRVTNEVNGRLETESTVNVPGLSKLSNETLAKVIDEINGKK